MRRLHHVLARRTITSKDGAGHFALETYDPRWHGLVTNAMRFRATGFDDIPDAGDPARRGREVVAFAGAERAARVR